MATLLKSDGTKRKIMTKKQFDKLQKLDVSNISSIFGDKIEE